MDNAALTQLLTGQHARLWPYAPAYFSRDLLGRVWTLMELEHAWPRLFWWQDVPDAQKGDLVAFAQYMRNKTPLLVQRLQDGKLVGLIYFDEVIQGLRGNISVWYARAAWGPLAHEATGMATQYGHQCLQLPALWGVTPWALARQHALRCGYKAVATFPRYVYLNGKPMPMHFTCHEE